MRSSTSRGQAAGDPTHIDIYYGHHRGRAGEGPFVNPDPEAADLP